VAQKTTKEKKKSPTLDTVLADFNSAWEYAQGSWHSRWSDNYKLYNNNRVKRGYEGITDTFVPMAFSTVETKTSALFGTKPKFTYIPPQDRADQETDILNGLLDYYWDKDQWSIKVINWGRSMLMLGTAVIYLFWEKDHPVMLNVPIRDFFIDPMATNLENARFMGRRYLTTKDELESFEVVDVETEEMVPKYKDLKKIIAGAKGENTDKQEKDMFYGSTASDPKNDQVEVIEYWTEDRVISIANRSVVIEDTENYYKAKARKNGAEYPCGIMPFAGLRDYSDESLYYAKGEIDFIADQQELLNDITNQNVDSVTFTLNQMYTLHPKYAHLLGEIENLPGAVYLAEADALQPIQQRPIPTDAFNERMNLKNEIRETSASNEVVKGVGQDSQATATEINAQIAGSGQRLGLLVTQIEDEGFHRLARIVFEMIKLYVTEPMMVRIMGKDGAKWEEFDPSEYQGDYEPRVQLDISVENQKQTDAANAKEMLAAFLGDPEINQVELKKMVLAKSFNLDPDEVGSLIQEQDPMAMDPMMAEMGAMPPEMGAEMMPEMPMEEMFVEPLPEEPIEEPATEPIFDEETGMYIDPITGDFIPAEELGL
jgi:hypothetical protein